MLWPRSGKGPYADPNHSLLFTMRAPVPGSSAKDSRGHETRVLRLRGRMFATLLAEEAAVGDIGEKRVEIDQVYAFVADMLSHNVDIVTVVEFLD